MLYSLIIILKILQRLYEDQIQSITHQLYLLNINPICPCFFIPTVTTLGKVIIFSYVNKRSSLLSGLQNPLPHPAPCRQYFLLITDIYLLIIQICTTFGAVCCLCIISMLKAHRQLPIPLRINKTKFLI